MPVVIVETVNHEEPTCEYFSIANGDPGNTITNATKVPGRVLIIEKGDTLYDSGEYEKGASGMTIKIRGNNSAFRSIKPYKIKLQSKADMLCRGDEKKYKDKEWLLLYGMNLNNMVGWKVSELLKLQYTPAYKYVNVFMNGKHRGVYCLCESVKRNSECRLDVSKDEGFIVEKDPYYWNEDVFFRSLYVSIEYTFKYPDPDEITEEQIAYAQQRITDFERSVFRDTYDQYIDVESFASWLLAHEILGTQDAGGSNIYMTWYDSNSKIQMGNIWDLDTNYMVGDNWAAIHEWKGFLFWRMLTSEVNKSLADALYKKWSVESSWICDSMVVWLEEFRTSDACAAMDTSRQLLGQRAGIVANEIVSSIAWFNRRKIWLDEAMKVYAPISTNIAAKIPSHVRDSACYNLMGQRKKQPGKGLFVHDGRLMFCK